MAKSSTHIAPGGLGYFAHNSRESFSNSQVFFDEPNELWHTKDEAFKMFRSELAARSDAYTNRTKQKLQKKTVTQLSAVVNLHADHSMSDLREIADYLERELDTKVVQLSIHRDEGKLVHRTTGQVLTSGEHFFANPKNEQLYFDKEYKKPIDTGIMGDWDIEKNYHAHIEMMGLDSTGKSIKRDLSTHFFRKLQDFTAETLGMERGQKSQSYSKEQMQSIKSRLKPKSEYENDKAYGKAFSDTAKELGIFIERKSSKRKDTHEYKNEKARENEANAKALAKLKDVQAENTRLRAKLKEQSASREQYAELEALVRGLKAEARAKDLTIDSLQEQVTRYEALETINSKQEATISAKDAQIANLSDKLSKMTEAFDKASDMSLRTLKLLGIGINENTKHGEVEKSLAKLELEASRQMPDAELREIIKQTQERVKEKTQRKSKEQDRGLER